MKFNIQPPILFVTIALLSSSCFLNQRRVKEPKKDPKPISVSEEMKELGYYNDFRACYDVLHYAIEIEPNPENKTINGSVVFTCRLDSLSDTLQFDLHKNLDVKGIYIKDDSEPVPFNRNYRAIRFAIDEYEIKQGDVFKFKIEYGGKPNKAKKPPWRGGTVWKKDKNKLPWLGVACEGDGASIWLPCKDHNKEEADSISMSIICAPELVGVSNGKLQSVDTLLDGRLKFNWATSYPINTYNITYYVGDFVEIKDTVNAKRGVVDISHYVLRENKAKATEHFQQVHDIFHFFEQKFGPYSWVNDGFKLVESPYAGMEHQTAIAYGSGYKNTWYIHSDYIVLHETAHEWWGNSLSATDFAHIWIHEGMATFAEGLYAEHVEGEDGYLRKLGIDRWTIQNKRPIVGPEDLVYFNYKEADCYSKGAVALQTLRSVINNDSVFFDIIQSFYRENEMGLVTTYDFIDLVNAKTGEDYQWFFNQYFFSRHVPTLEHFVGFDGYVYHRWSNCEPDFKMEVDLSLNNVKYTLKTTTKLQRTEVHKTGNEHSFFFDNYAKYYRWNKDDDGLVEEFESALEEKGEF